MASKTICIRGVIILLLTLTANLHTMRAQTPDNPLLQNWETPFGAPPFDLIKTKDFEPAFDEAMKRHLAEIDAISSEGGRAHL